LYRQFKLDEPWDGPHNKVLLEKMPRSYKPALGGNDAPGLTRYQVFTGPGTAFERAGLTWDDFSDGLAQTSWWPRQASRCPGPSQWTSVTIPTSLCPRSA